jgi:hypothetical protein
MKIFVPSLLLVLAGACSGEPGTAKKGAPSAPATPAQCSTFVAKTKWLLQQAAPDKTSPILQTLINRQERWCMNELTAGQVQCYVEAENQAQALECYSDLPTVAEAPTKTECEALKNHTVVLARQQKEVVRRRNEEHLRETEKHIEKMRSMGSEPSDFDLEALRRHKEAPRDFDFVAEGSYNSCVFGMTRAQYQCKLEASDFDQLFGC